MERKLFTALQGENAGRLNDSLSQQGFRRSQNVLYRPSCADCASCLSARIDVAAFQPSKSQKRTLRRNAGSSAAPHRPGRPKINTTCSAAIWTAAMRMAAWPTWMSLNSPR